MNVRRSLLTLGTAVVMSALSLSPLASAAQPDYGREQRLADQIVDMILDGDPVWLEANGREFLGIYTEADEPRASVLILHGRGFHPDWVDTVNPLRVGLAELGYNTLSIQMPVLVKDSSYYEYVPIFEYAHARIESAIRFLAAQALDDLGLTVAGECCGHCCLHGIGDAVGRLSEQGQFLWRLDRTQGFHHARCLGQHCIRVRSGNQVAGIRG